MVAISQFFGITVSMFFNDHPPPHVHATYNEYEIVVRISPPRIMSGAAPVRVRRMVLAWCSLHQAELLANWERCRGGIAPWRVRPFGVD
jgi:hypothetical protein